MMRTTVTNHGQGIYSLDCYDAAGHLIRRVDGLTSMQQCRAEADRARKQAAGLLLLPGLDDLPTTATVTTQTRMF